MMTAWNDLRVGRWAMKRRLLLLALLAPLALTGCPETTTPSGNGEPAAEDLLPTDENVAPSPLLNTPDGALAQGDTIQGQVGEALTFDAAGSVDSDGAVIGYEWDFGDGSPLETEVSVTHTYAEPGEYTVTLTVIDDAAERTTLTITVVIAGADPVASFTAAPTSGQTPLTVDFDASASIDSDGDIVAYTWVPGDGSGPFGGVTLSYTYETAGTFTATLTVDDDDGNSGSMSLDIEVQAANQIPLAVLDATPLTGVEPLTVAFDATGSSDPDGLIAAYALDYGDNSGLAIGAVASHVYVTVGTYTAELVVTDDEGATDLTTVEITVEEPNLAPTAMIGANPTTGPAPLTVTFDAAGSSDADGEVFGYCWKFGDSDPEVLCDATSATVLHTYEAIATYEATLYVTDELNLASETVSIDIEATGPDVVSLAVETTCFELDPNVPETADLIVMGTLSDESELDVTDDADTIYVSSDDTIATVDEGVITAVAVGEATIEVSRTDPTVTPVDVTVHVTTVPLYGSLDVTPSTVDLFLGYTAQLTVEGVSICDLSLTTDLTADSATIYASDDVLEEVISVDAEEITAVGVGEATITVSHPDATLETIVLVSVTVEPLGGIIVSDDADGIVEPGDPVDLDMQATGGYGQYSFDWEVDATGTTNDDTGDDEVFTPSDSVQMVTFTPPPGEEGSYIITCSVGDTADPGGDPFVAGPITIIATTLTAEPVVENNDGCIVGLPSDNIPCETCSTGTLQEEFHELTLLANASGGVGDLDYSWTADLNSFVDPNMETPEWIVPHITDETTVTFTVTITDDGLLPPISIPFASMPWIVSPALELSAIGYDDEPAVVLVEFPITFSREADGGMEPLWLGFSDLPAEVSVGGDCDPDPDAPTSFDELDLNCTFTFDTADEYTLTVVLRDGCAGETQGQPKPTISYDFTVEVVPGGP